MDANAQIVRAKKTSRQIQLHAERLARILEDVERCRLRDELHPGGKRSDSWEWIERRFSEVT